MAKTIKRKVPRATTTKTKAAADPIAGDGARTLLGSAELTFARPDQLTRHPDNREPSPAAVAAMVASMRAEGQIEPLLVRPMPGPQGERAGAWGWQIISGETRWRAARDLGLGSLAVRVVEATDPRALELMAVCNARRVDLDPIEKARLIAKLCAPIAAGGAGLTREAAAKIYGLESGAAASNLARLLDLPAAWRERVASGAVPQSVARLLLPYVEAPRILAAISASWEKAQAPKALDWDRENWATRERAAAEIEDLVAGATRPIDKKRPIGYSAKELGTYDKPRPRLFDLTDELRASLDVVTVKIGGKPVEVATDVEAFDRLQIPLVKKAIAKSRKNARPPVEPVADPKASAKVAADKLIERVAAWRCGVLRFRIASALEEPRPPSPLRGVRAAAFHQRIVERLLVAAILGDEGLAGDLSAALLDAVPSGLRKDLGGPASQLAAAWSTLGRLDKVDPSGVSTLIATAWAAVLRADEDPRFPRFPLDYLEQLAADLGLGTIGDLWPKLTPAERGAFYGEHNAEQLVALAEELGVFVPEGKAKATAVEILLGKGGRVPVPRILGEAKAKRKRGK